MQTVDQASSTSQVSVPQQDSSPLDLLVSDLRGLRNGMIDKTRRHRSAILVGQLAILAGEYRDGRRPSRRTLRRFFYLIGQGKAA